MASAALEMPGIFTIICDYFHIFITHKPNHIFSTEATKQDQIKQ